MYTIYAISLYIVYIYAQLGPNVKICHSKALNRIASSGRTITKELRRLEWQISFDLS